MANIYEIKTDTFTLKFEPEVYIDDISYPVNTSLRISVVSYGFSAGKVMMDISVRDLAEFAAVLNSMYETFEGSAKLKEPYGAHSFIKFYADKGGHIKVKGNLHNGMNFGYIQELSFENELDRKYLREFAKGIYEDYREYEEGKE